MTLQKNIADDAPQQVRRLIHTAIERRASDLYWLPRADCTAVRCRINGQQEDLAELPRDLGEQCLTHIKVLARLLTYRTQIAQDGVIRHDDGSELRVATMPTLFGERITIRLLNQEHGPAGLDELGFTEASLTSLRRILLKPQGLIVLTGPTGCGKTTTIYALLRDLLQRNQDPASIISLEDPVESIIPGISQSAVSSGSEDWNYEKALRAALRQDVKTLVIGEMRDSGVVRVVLDAALTGHRIITTYHAGDIPSVYARLLHQGFEPFLIAAAITGVVTQRLVPGRQGRLVPAAAVLEPDDTWREFICAKPDLGTLRRKIQDYPDADLNRALESVTDIREVHTKVPVDLEGPV